MADVSQGPEGPRVPVSGAPPRGITKTVRCCYCGVRKSRYGHVRTLQRASIVWNPKEPAREAVALPAASIICSHHRVTPCATDAVPASVQVAS